MTKLRVRQFKAAFLRLAKLVAHVGEIVVMRRGKPLLRILPGARRRHSRAKLRLSMDRIKPAAELAERKP